jgi:hypothetical protein
MLARETVKLLELGCTGVSRVESMLSWDDANSYSHSEMESKASDLTEQELKDIEQAKLEISGDTSCYECSEDITINAIHIECMKDHQLTYKLLSVYFTAALEYAYLNEILPHIR